MLMKDDAIRRRPAERDALIAGGVRAFCLTNAQLTGAEQARRFVENRGTESSAGGYDPARSSMASTTGASSGCGHRCREERARSPCRRRVKTDPPPPRRNLTPSGGWRRLSEAVPSLVVDGDDGRRLEGWSVWSSGPSCGGSTSSAASRSSGSARETGLSRNTVRARAAQQGAAGLSARAGGVGAGSVQGGDPPAAAGGSDADGGPGPRAA